MVSAAAQNRAPESPSLASFTAISINNTFLIQQQPASNSPRLHQRTQLLSAVALLHFRFLAVVTRVPANKGSASSASQILAPLLCSINTQCSYMLFNDSTSRSTVSSCSWGIMRVRVVQNKTVKSYDPTSGSQVWLSRCEPGEAPKFNKAVVWVAIDIEICRYPSGSSFAFLAPWLPRV